MNKAYRKKFRASSIYSAISVVVILIAQSTLVLAQLSKETSPRLDQPLEAEPIQSVNQEWLRAILGNPRNPANQRGQHSLQYNPEEFAHAIQALDQEIALNPQDEVLYYQRGFLRYKEGNFEKAIEDFRKILDNINQNDDIAHFNIGLSYYGIYSRERNAENLDQAKAYISKAIQIDPEGWLGWLREQRRNPILDDLKVKLNQAIEAFRGDRRRSEARRSIGPVEKQACTEASGEFIELCKRAKACKKEFESGQPDASCKPYFEPG